MLQPTQINIKELDRVLLKDGRRGTIMLYEKGKSSFIFEPDDESEIYNIPIDEIEKILHD